MFPELRFGWHANDGALKSLQGVFQQYRSKPEAADAPLSVGSAPGRDVGEFVELVSTLGHFSGA
jgi:hypothetical protein